ncbi:MAG: DNA-binding response regulator [Caldilinea sp. CFX5]|nr:DNA-binding response regulator [Caldilinea sp. CFX5]
MSEKIRIVLVDDHAVLRAGLTALLNAEADMTVVGEAGDGAVSLGVVADRQPDVVLLDINMPNMGGLEALGELRKVAPQSRVLILTMHDDQTYLRQALSQGAAGYVLKQAADSELLTAIRTVYHGGAFLHPSHAQALLAPTAVPGSGQSAASDDLSILSERELEVLKLIALGHANKEIAEMLYLSVKTVETYKTRIMEKLNLTSRAALVRFALKQGLLTADEP